MSAPKRPKGRRSRTKAAVGRTRRASSRSPGSVIGKGSVSNRYRSPPSRTFSDSCVVWIAWGILPGESDLWWV
ncbi:hypothetical protein GW17_00041543 [Ensete ventricosum]|nr:hypothetical protein GW17_00041543 [Ensete ventricosum]